MAKFWNALCGAAALALLAGGASAASYTYATKATEVLGGSVDTQCMTASRDDLCNALGAPDGDFPGGGFFSIGNAPLGVIFEFGTLFTGPITVWEITGGNVASYVEGLDLTFFALTPGGDQYEGILNTQGTKVAGTNARYEIMFDVSGGPFSAILVRGRNDTEDGFDIDAIAVSAVPLPAAGLMLMAGLGGLAAARRRKG